MYYTNIKQSFNQIDEEPQPSPYLQHTINI